jgi:hypothetical protein
MGKERAAVMPLRCVICNDNIDGMDHDAAPVKKGRCCTRCHSIRVIPQRIRVMREEGSK